MDDFKKIILPILGVMLFIVVVGLVYGNKETKIPFSGNSKSKEEKNKTVDIKINNTIINAAVADNEDLRKIGLGGKEQLAENEGMLFVFDKKDIIASFWMKDMLIAIDILWINDSKIIQIDKDIKPPKKGTPDKDLKTYISNKPVDYVLEVAGGYSDKKGIKEGDIVEISKL